MIRLALGIIILSGFPIMGIADGFIQYPVVYHCPSVNEIAIQSDGSFEATSYISGLSIQWKGSAKESAVGVEASSFKKTVLACDGETCLVFCDYRANKPEGNIIRLEVSKANFSSYKGLPGGYGQNWKNNQCIRENNKECVFQIVESY